MKRIFILCAIPALLGAQAVPVEIGIKADSNAVRVSPSLYGLMTEEINYSYDGGLYGELIRNRSLKEDSKEPVHWQLVQDAGAEGSMGLDGGSLKLTVTSGKAGVANDGFWGITVRPNTRYRATVYAKGDAGTLTVALIGNDGTVRASAHIPRLTGETRKYEATLTTGANVPVSKDNRLVIMAGRPGTVWFSMVSLFPPTYKGRSNGNRPDIMELLADMKPAFLRFPGGNYLEGNTIATRFDWKKTIGPVPSRPGHLNDAWRYWSSDGMGLLEFLNWCEDLHMQPLLAVYAGYSMRPPARVKPGADLEPYVQDALDEIEYVTGDGKTTWGARRVKDGHPAPFNLTYVEVGNEDNFDRAPGSYDGRFTQFYDAVKKKYPQIRVIATTKVTTRMPDLLDEHYYRRSEDEMASHAHDYDSRPRSGEPKIFVGEWATRVGAPTPNMSGALGDAAWMTGMERNSDIVLMSCYAPLFVNVNEGAMQWPTDLIGYDALSAYGSPGYWAQQMFSSHHGDVVLTMTERAVPTRTWTPPPGRGRAGEAPPPALPAQQVPLVFFSATRDSKSGMIYLKVVNRESTPQPVHVSLTGLSSVDPKGEAITMAASSPDDTNSITEQRKIVPAAMPVEGLSADFTRPFPPYSITVLQIKAR